MDQLSVCMKQKLVLLTKTADITKQLEVQSRQPDINTDGMNVLVDERQVYLDRLEKCCQFVKGTCGKLPEDKIPRVKQILSGKLPEGCCTPAERDLCQCGADCGAALQKAKKTDALARQALENECGRLQKLLHTAHLKSRKSSAVKAETV